MAITVDRVFAVEAFDSVVTIAAIKFVVSSPIVEPIVIRSTDQCVIAIAAVQSDRSTKLPGIDFNAEPRPRAYVGQFDAPHAIRV